jgi:leader peptidase (prepilin peptidase)/N-methyltransferase
LHSSILIVLILASLAVGSFLNVVIYRLPQMLISSEKQLNLSFPASHCPHCKQALRRWHNIPLISFLLLRGKCAYCKTRIHWRYPFVELLTLTTSLIVMQYQPLYLPLIAALVFSWFLIALVFIDIDHQLLPDRLTLPLVILGLITNYFGIFTSFQNAVIGAIVAYLLLWLVSFLFEKLRNKEGLGGGDVKLLAALGAWLGWQQLPLILLISSVLCLIVMLVLMLLKKHKADQPFAFGPFLAIAGWVLLVFSFNLY